MKTSTFIFATDLADEGFNVVLDRLQEAHLDGLTMACNYHHSRDVFPHNPVHRVRYMQGGVFFQPTPAHYENLKIKPDVPAWVQESDPLQKACDAASQRGMLVRAWTNNMHSTIHGTSHLDCTVQNVFGDRYINNLCPANPDVRAYVRTMNSDLARYPLDALMVESICYMPFDHGYHHERCLVPINLLSKYLLGLCFCEHCESRLAMEGVKVKALKAYVADQLDKHLAGDPSDLDGRDLTRHTVEQLGGGDMAAVLKARQATVTSLVSETREAVAEVSNSPVLVMEWSGGLRGAGMGMPVGDTSSAAPERAWQDGVDLKSVFAACDGVGVLGYVRTVADLERDLPAYRAALPTKAQLSVAIRPMPPDVESASELEAKVRFLRGYGADWVEFYHYGFMRLKNLDWIAEALQS